jgi:hypothetical protein
MGVHDGEVDQLGPACPQLRRRAAAWLRPRRHAARATETAGRARREELRAEADEAIATWAAQ